MTIERSHRNVLALDLAAGLSLEEAGAKATNLGKALSHGFTVPLGVVVTRKAMRLFLVETGLAPTVEALVAQASGGDGNGASYTEIHEAILTAPLPSRLLHEVGPLLESTLARAPHGVAVRSSGTQEDSAAASFAGIHESFLGVGALEDLWMAVRRCWCSALTPTAHAYAARMGLDLLPDGMAVLVQAMVPADSAGILFTADTNTGNPWRFTLESTFGLAQEIVGAAGTAPVDHFELDWSSGAVLDRQIAAKSTEWRLTHGGVERVALSEERGRTASLDDEMVEALARLGLEIDRCFGYRADIEWAIADGEVHIVQVRPLTALPAFFPHHLPAPGSGMTWLLAPPGRLPHRPAGGRATAPLCRGLSILGSARRWTPGPASMISGSAVGFEADLNGFRYMARQEAPDPGGNAEKEAFLCEHEPALREHWLRAKNTLYPDVAAEADRRLGQASSLRDWIDAILWARDAGHELHAVSAGPTGLLHHTCRHLLQVFVEEHLPGQSMDPFVQGYHPALVPYYPLTYVAETEELAMHVEDGAVRQAFEVSEITELLARLSVTALGSTFLEAFEAHCCRYGLLPPRGFTQLPADEWPDGHTELQIVRGRLQGRQSVIETYELATRRRQEVQTRLTTALARKDTAIVPRFHRLLDWALFWGSALNDRGAANIPGYKLGWLNKAASLALLDAGLVDDASEIGLFTDDDMALLAATEDVPHGRRILQRRRHEYEYVSRLQPLPFLGRPPANAGHQHTAESDHEKLPPEHEESSVIRGKGLVTGRAHGRARRITTLEEEPSVAVDDILLFTAPINPTAGYTPVLLSLMMRVRGMVTQEHLTNTNHIAQVARECAVPIVQITPVQMESIPDGAPLRLDGGEGTVNLQP